MYEKKQTTKNMYLALHIIQTVPSNCMNRDDIGNPKTAVFGGATRARVSSQAWKRAAREMFYDLYAQENKGYRTRDTREMVAEQICKNDPEISEEEALKTASGLLELSKNKKKSSEKGDSKKKKNTESGDDLSDKQETKTTNTGEKGSEEKGALFFISTKQIENVAALADEYRALGPMKASEKKKAETLLKGKVIEALKKDPSIDVLLFGRMAAGNPDLNHDAVVQAAHSLSTHAISNEYDYYTAMDDHAGKAGYLDTQAFNSATLYRHAIINITELSEYLTEEELAAAVCGFAESFILSMPKGKKNAFANLTYPDLVYAVAQEDRPVNLMDAFDEPVQTHGQGGAKASKMALSNYVAQVYSDYVVKPDKAWVIGECEGICAERVNIKEFLKELGQTVSEYKQDGE